MNILDAWQRLHRIPWVGSWLFRRIIRRVAPYSSSIYPSVRHLAVGHASVFMKDRRSLHNPFESLHAIALANLGELACGLAVLTAIPKHKRGIVTQFRIEFFKKARGGILAKSQTESPREDGPFEVVANLTDAQGVRVAMAVATWQIGTRDGVSGE